MPNAMKNTKLFQDLAPTIKRITQERLLFELCAVREHFKKHGGDFREDKDLNGAFTWLNSPQGYEYWSLIWREYTLN